MYHGVLSRVAAAVWILLKVDIALAPKNREHGERPHAAACMCGGASLLQHVNWNPDMVGSRCNLYQF